MKKLFNPFFTLIVLAFSNGCIEKTIDLDLSDGLYGGDKIVLNGYLSSDEGCIVKVSKSSPSIGRFTYEQLKFRDARVFLYENGDSIAELKSDTAGIFSLKTFKPKVDAKYKIRATSSSLPNCESEEEIFPSALQNTAVKPVLKDNIIFGRPALIFPIILNFDPSKTNYFISDGTAFFPSGEKGRVDLSLLNILETVSSESACDSYYFGPTAGYSTKCYEPGDTLNFAYDYKFNGDLTVSSAKSVTLNLSTVSPSFYKYAKVMRQPVGFETAFVEPNTIYTNIKGGYGLFYTINSKRFTYKF